MRDSAQVKLEFIHNAVAGNYTPEQAEAELDRMEQAFGKTVFSPGGVTKKSRPWSRGDLKDLEMQAVDGASSRPFFLYLAEMGEEVTRKERKKKQLTLIGTIVAVIAIIAVIAGVVRALRGT